jgi:hypothetical protein
MLNITFMRVIMLNVVWLNAVMLNVVAPLADLANVDGKDFGLDFRLSKLDLCLEDQ